MMTAFRQLKKNLNCATLVPSPNNTRMFFVVLYVVQIFNSSATH